MQIDTDIQEDGIHAYIQEDTIRAYIQTNRQTDRHSFISIRIYRHTHTHLYEFVCEFERCGLKPQTPRGV